MKICFFVDARSPIAQNWIRYYLDRGWEVDVISSYPSGSDVLPGARLTVIPLGFSELAARARSFDLYETASDWTHGDALAAMTRDYLFPIASSARSWLAPAELVRHISRVRSLVRSIRPDLVHAMRIPFEGMMAALSVRDVPVVVSVWGNDFTLHAAGNPLIAALSRYTLRRVDALHCDCQRDLRLAIELGFDTRKPAAVLPSAGGIDLSVFHPDARGAGPDLLEGLGSGPVVVNPRGFRGYVRNDEFFRAIPIVLDQVPTARFVCSSMATNEWARHRVRELNLEASVRLLPYVPHSRMAAVLGRADVAVSPSTHDGTPNSLLESMACGAFPVAGDIESVREWITDGYNGLLCDPTDPKALAAAIIRALADAPLRERAAAHNRELVSTRAEHGEVMRAATEFYRRIVGPVHFNQEDAACAG